MNSSDPDGPHQSPGSEALAPQLQRLGQLRAAWGVLAASVVVESGQEISRTGRLVTDHLASLTRTRGDLSEEALTGAEDLLDEFERCIRKLTPGILVAQLPSTLPAHLSTDRAGLLALLDVLIGHIDEYAEGLSQQISAIDYLITLLCSSDEASSGVIRHDPIELTPRLRALSDLADARDDLRIPDIEAELFAAANTDGEDLRDEIQLRTLRKRKAELGTSFFASRILRAIVSYNTALIGRVSDEIFDSGDWGVIDDETGLATGPDEAGSVFDSPALRSIAEAVRRRAQGREPEPAATDRIAWALDFDYLDKPERKALLGDCLCTRTDPIGTAILVGLTCRSIAVLSIELQSLGLAPDDVSDVWVKELERAFQDEINRHIASDAYKVACALSELKNKFLFAPLGDQFREKRCSDRPARSTPAVSADAKESRGKADSARADSMASEKPTSTRDLVRDALERSRDDVTARSRRVPFHEWPWARIAQGVAVAAVVATIGVVGFDLERAVAEADSEAPRPLPGIA